MRARRPTLSEISEAAKIIASLGGQARMTALTPTRRKKIASDAAHKRWKGTSRKARSAAAR
jgi:hypothetical protein